MSPSETASFENSDTGITVDSGTNNNELIEGNTIRDCGFLDNMNNHKVPHSGMQLGQMSNSTVRRNVIARTRLRDLHHRGQGGGGRHQ